MERARRMAQEILPWAIQWCKEKILPDKTLPEYDALVEYEVAPTTKIGNLINQPRWLLATTQLAENTRSHMQWIDGRNWYFSVRWVVAKSHRGGGEDYSPR